MGQPAQSGVGFGMHEMADGSSPEHDAQRTVYLQAECLAQESCRRVVRQQPVRPELSSESDRFGFPDIQQAGLLPGNGLCDGGSVSVSTTSQGGLCQVGAWYATFASTRFGTCISSARLSKFSA